MPLLSEHKLRGELQEEAGQYKVTIIGKSAHGAMPASGVNGATYLALFHWHIVRRMSMFRKANRSNWQVFKD